MPLITKCLIIMAIVWSSIFTSSYAIWEIRRKNFIAGITVLAVVGLLLGSAYYFVQDCANGLL